MRSCLWLCNKLARLSNANILTYLRDHAHNKTLLLDLVGLDGVVILEDLAGVDELLGGRLPALLCGDLGLDRADGFAGLSLDGEALLLEVLEGELHGGQALGG